MLLDTQAIFSDNQALTTSAASTNVIKTGGVINEISFGTPIPLLIQVTEDFAAVKAIKAAVQTAVDEDFTTPVTLAESGEIPLSELKAGYKFPINFIPKGNKGYLRLYYTLTFEGGSAATAGKITAGIAAGIDNSYQDV